MLKQKDNYDTFPKENAPINQDHQENKATLERLYDSIIKESNGNSIPFGAWEKVSLVLLTLGASGGIYAIPPTRAYAAHKPPWLKWSLPVSNTLSYVLFLAKATDDLLDFIAIEAKAPPALQDIVKLMSKKQLALKYTKMLTGALICSIPFGIIAYMFPLFGYREKAWLVATMAHSTLSNMILHAISWNFILTPEMWYYRLPYLPFEKLYELLKNMGLSKEQKKVLELEHKRFLVYEKYKKVLQKSFADTAYKIIDDNIRNRGNVVANTLHQIGNSDASLMTFAQHRPTEDAKSRSFLMTCCQNMNSVLANRIIGPVGAAFMMIGCIGWIADPVYIGLIEGLNWPESLAAGGLPAYSMAVLCAFYGASVVKQAYNYVTTWQGGLRHKLTPEARLYPKTFGLFLLFNIYIAGFSYAIAEELITTIFGAKMFDAYRPYLKGAAIPALELLVFVSLLELFNTLIRKSVAKFGPEGDNKLMMRLLTKVPVFNQRLQQMEGKTLIEGLGSYTDEQLKHLGIDPEAFKADQKKLNEHGAEIENELSTWKEKKGTQQHASSNRFSLWWHNDEESESDPLLNTTPEAKQESSALRLFKCC